MVLHGWLYDGCVLALLPGPFNGEGLLRMEPGKPQDCL